MNELNDTDAFRVGRYIMVRWGRHVPHHDEEMSVRPKGGGISAGSIQVTVPPDPERVHFISTVAFDVARDERPIEEKLKHDPDFPCSDPERIYYLWCVWKFAHGESWTSWCAEPFTMQEGGPTWIPPPLPHGVDNKEHRNANPKRSLNDTRRRHGATSDGQELTSQELDDFNLLFRRQLTTSRGSICKAMAFCFDKSGSFRHICNMLQELLQEEPAKDMPKDVVMEQKIAQLFLLSDILFNSQQPGVRNAFRYRDAIEKMAPDVFTALGKMEWGGRLTRNKLAVEISSILGAWTNWSVYSPWFLDELHDRFEGRSIKPKESDVTESLTKDDDRPGDINMEPEINATDPQPLPHDECRPKGDWAVIEPLSEMQNETVKTRSNNEECFSISNASCTEGTQPNDLEEDSDVDGDPVDADDIDGEPLEEDVKENPSDEDFDGEPFDDDNVDGELIDEEVDGEPLDDENIDGESVEEGVFEE